MIPLKERFWIGTHRDNGKEGGLKRRGGDRSTTRHQGKERAGVKLSSWPEIGSDGDVLLTPYVPKGITGYDDDDELEIIFFEMTASVWESDCSQMD
jgi:hypothetical protein